MGKKDSRFVISSSLYIVCCPENVKGGGENPVVFVNYEK